MAEGFRGQSREALVPAICEYLSIPYTGSDPLTLALSLHKGRTKETLAFRGVPTAPFACLETADDVDRLALPFPVFVKPVAEGSGKGGFSNNLCDGPAARRSPPTTPAAAATGAGSTSGSTGSASPTSSSSTRFRASSPTRR